MRKRWDKGEQFVHIYDRTAGQIPYLRDPLEKMDLLRTIRRAAAFSEVAILNYCVLDNHYHLLVHVMPKREISMDEMKDHVRALYGDARGEKVVNRWEDWEKDGETEKLQEEFRKYYVRMFSLSQFEKTVKETFVRDFHKRHPDHYGTLWQSRFGSTRVEDLAWALRDFSCYVELNPVKAGICYDPAVYEYSSWGAANRGGAYAVRCIKTLVDAIPFPDRRPVTEDEAMTYVRNMLEDALPGCTTGDEARVKERLAQARKKPSQDNYLLCLNREFEGAKAYGSMEFVQSMIDPARTYDPTRKAKTHDTASVLPCQRGTVYR